MPRSYNVAVLTKFRMPELTVSDGEEVDSVIRQDLGDWFSSALLHERVKLIELDIEEIDQVNDSQSGKENTITEELAIKRPGPETREDEEGPYQFGSYRISGVLRFSDDEVLAENYQEARNYLEEVDVSLVHCVGGCEIGLLESSIEDLGPWSEDDDEQEDAPESTPSQVDDPGANEQP